MSELIGDWNKVAQNIEQMDQKVQDAAKLGIKQSALLLEATIVKHFDAQDLGWAALKPAYKKMKAATGKSTDILRATNALYSSITNQISADGYEAFVGVLRKSKRKDGLPATLIAAVHEYGSAARGIPARPFLRPSWKEKRQEVLNLVIKRLSDALKV